MSRAAHFLAARVRWRVCKRPLGRWAPMGAAMGGLLLVYAGWQLFRWPAGHRMLIGDMFFYPVSAAAIGASLAAAKRCADQPRCAQRGAC
jgi:hypothetical protein